MIYRGSSKGRRDAWPRGQLAGGEYQSEELASQLLKIDSVVIVDPDVTVSDYGWWGKKASEQDRQESMQRIFVADARRELAVAGYRVADFPSQGLNHRL